MAVDSRMTIDGRGSLLVFWRKSAQNFEFCPRGGKGGVSLRANTRCDVILPEHVRSKCHARLRVTQTPAIVYTSDTTSTSRSSSSSSLGCFV